MDLVDAAGERCEHAARVGRVARLAELRAVADDDGVDAEDGPPASVDRAGLAGGVLDRVAARLLLEVGRH